MTMLGRIPAQCCDKPAKAPTTLSSNYETNADSMHQNADCQQVQYSFGNRCGHFPSSPRTANLPSHHRNRFPFLEQAKRNMQASYNDPLAFEMGKIFFHPDKQLKRGGFRKRRSEMREAICGRVGVAIAHTVNMKKWALGEMIGNGTFQPYGIEKMARWAGVSIYQWRRAFNIFAKHGYVSLEEKRYFDSRDGKWKSETPVMMVSPDFLLHLGISEDEIRKKQAKQIKEVEKTNREFKSAEFTRNQQSNKKAQKKAMKRINEVLDLAKTIKKQKSGKSLTRAENELLSAELPGHNRNRYRDYTGCSETHVTSLQEAQSAFSVLENIFKPPNSS